jgi:hypothetical protein
MTEDISMAATNVVRLAQGDDARNIGDGNDA